MADIPRSEYPRPTFVRPRWLCLNGTWEFEIDHGDSGLERGLLNRPLGGQITVPFCPESTLSGVGNVDFMMAVWYRRVVDIPADWKGRVLLHFQAVDHDATVWADGKQVGRHRGGWTPFTCDLGHCAGRRVTLTVRARDDWKTKLQARGKQALQYGNSGCVYTRTTGIWQTVWLEPVPMEVRLERPRITPNWRDGGFVVEQPLTGARGGLRVRATLSTKGEQVAVDEQPAEWPCARLELKALPAKRRAWSVADPHLYDLAIELRAGDGTVIDHCRSYAGLRNVAVDGKAILINDEPVFQRLVLDQGYWADGIMTAPSDAALVRDIQLSQQAGFNGARLHQKVFEERFLYHADRLGYLCWGEFGDWGGHDNSVDGVPPAGTYVAQWLEAVERDYSHPSIIGWCPLNESWQELTDRITNLDDMTRAMFLSTKLADRTRPVLDASGYSHRVPETDVYDCHDYEQDPAKLKANQAGLADGKPYMNTHWQTKATWSVPYAGQPFFVSEFGGIWWNPKAKPGEDSWGYGDRVKDIEAFYARFDGLCRVLLEDADMFGYCYTQLTDVFQEQNGIYGFDRSVKFDMARIKAAQTRVAAFEKRAGVAPAVAADGRAARA